MPKRLPVRALAVLVSVALEAAGAGVPARAQTVSAPEAIPTLAVPSALPLTPALAPLSNIGGNDVTALKGNSALRLTPLSAQLPPPGRGRIEVGVPRSVAATSAKPAAASPIVSLRETSPQLQRNDAAPLLRSTFD